MNKCCVVCIVYFPKKSIIGTSLIFTYLTWWFYLTSECTYMDLHVRSYIARTCWMMLNNAWGLKKAPSQYVGVLARPPVRNRSINAYRVPRSWTHSLRGQWAGGEEGPTAVNHAEGTESVNRDRAVSTRQGELVVRSPLDEGDRTCCKSCTKESWK